MAGTSQKEEMMVSESKVEPTPCPVRKKGKKPVNYIRSDTEDEDIFQSPIPSIKAKRITLTRPKIKEMVIPDDEVEDSDMGDIQEARPLVASKGKESKLKVGAALTCALIQRADVLMELRSPNREAPT